MCFSWLITWPCGIFAGILGFTRFTQIQTHKTLFIDSTTVFTIWIRLVFSYKHVIFHQIWQINNGKGDSASTGTCARSSHATCNHIELVNSLFVCIHTGRWYTYPSEKYEFVSWDDYPNIWKNKTCSKPPTSISFLMISTCAGLFCIRSLLFLCG
jgi:hypothetical protein